MHTRRCRVAVHLQSLFVALNTAHTIHDIYHAVVIIAFTFGSIFLNAFLDNVQPSILWVPDGLR